MNTSEDLWYQVCDFTKNPDTPNWVFLDASEYAIETKELEDFSEPDKIPVPIPTQYGGELEIDFEKLAQKGREKNEEDGMMEFDIKVGADAAIEALKNKENQAEEWAKATNAEDQQPELAKPANNINEVSPDQGAGDLLGGPQGQLSSLSGVSEEVQPGAIPGSLSLNSTQFGVGLSSEDQERAKALEERNSLRAQDLHQRNVD